MFLFRVTCAMRQAIGVSSVVSMAMSLTVISAASGEEAPLRQAHAHNDYHHKRPLLDALQAGFCSVEADIYWTEEELRVGHDRSELRPGRTLQKLYLDPLRERVASNGGRVYRNGPEFLLLVDIKSEGAATFAPLHTALNEYRDMLVTVRDGREHAGAVRVVVSGNRDWDLIASYDPRYAGIDGRRGDLDSDHPAHLVPLISDNWTRYFAWRGEGKLSPEEAIQLATWVDQAHSAGRKIRFWATPDQPTAWDQLQRANVDLINTDNLAGLSQFLRSHP